MGEGTGGAEKNEEAPRVPDVKSASAQQGVNIAPSGLILTKKSKRRGSTTGHEHYTFSFEELCEEAKRLVKNSEMEITGEVVAEIWKLAVQRLASDLKLGRPVALSPLGTFYPQEDGVEVRVSEHYALQYGLPVKKDADFLRAPAGKVNLKTIGAAFDLSDTTVQNIVTGLLEAFGECSSGEVELSLGSLGVLSCKNRDLSIRKTVSGERWADPASPKKQSVRSMLHRRAEQRAGKLEPLATSQSAARLESLKASAAPDSGIGGMALNRSRSASTMIPDRTDETFVPLLDYFARTTCVPYRGEVAKASVSDLIASNFSPAAGFLRLDASQVLNGVPCAVVWHRERVETCTKPVDEPVPLADRFDFLANYGSVEEESPLDLELREANLSADRFGELLARYDYYCSDGVPTQLLAAYNEEWLRNSMCLVPTELDGVKAGKVQAMVSELRREIIVGYIRAAKQAVVDYIAMDTRGALRAGLLLRPRAVPEWGRSPFTVPDIGTFGGPPDEWRQGLEKVRDTLCITSLGQGPLHLQTLWKEKYESIRLVDIPEKPAKIVDIEQFMGSQMNILEASVTTLQTDWLEDFVHISVEGNVWANSPREPQYFEQVAALLSAHLRSCVEASLLEYRAPCIFTL
jgi:hypothetical protein